MVTSVVTPREHVGPLPESVARVTSLHRIEITTANGQRYFTDWGLAAEACRVMTASAQWQRSRLLAWVLMPDQWQGLIALGGFDDLAGCVGRLKYRSARMLTARNPGLGPLWANDFHAARVKDELAAARSLVMNPVRTGLVKRIGDYPFWDARWLQRRR